MIEALIVFLIYLVIIVLVAMLLLWAIGKFFPEIGTPARYVVGAIVVILILLALLQVMRGGMPAFP